MDMSVAYVPSMRNGPSAGIDEREDRGSAILSTETLSGITAIELPFGKQRRVAVLATVTPAGPPAAPVHVIAGHFDSLVGTRRQAATLAGYIDELNEIGEPVVLGIDTNAVRGRADGAVHALEKALSIEAVRRRPDQHVAGTRGLHLQQPVRLHQGVRNLRGSSRLRSRAADVDARHTPTGLTLAVGRRLSATVERASQRVQVSDADPSDVARC